MSFHRGQSTNTHTNNRYRHWRKKHHKSEIKPEAPKVIPAMQYVKLGANLVISRLGLGCMGMSEFYGPSDEKKCIQVIHRAVELGVNFFDTADIYSFGDNEKLLAKALKGIPRHMLVIATKGGIIRKKDDPTARGVSNKPEYIKACVEASLKRLDTDYIDLYYLHRLDPDTSIEEAMGALVELVKAGKIRHIGLSEADPEIIRRAHQIYPITAVQTEYSLWTRFVENNEVLRVCRELNIGFVPYSPLGRGLLTGQIDSPDKLEEKDYRCSIPRFQAEHLQRNFANLDPVIKLAKDKGCTPAQIALAWIFAQGQYFGQVMAPIPGTRNIKYLEENITALGISLSKTELFRLNQLRNNFSGERYSQLTMDFYSLHPSVTGPDRHSSILAIFKIILTICALRGLEVGKAYAVSKIQRYQGAINTAKPDEINIFIQTLLGRAPFKSTITGRNVATAFFEALLDYGIFDVLFPEISNPLLKAEERYYAILKIIDGILEQIERGILAKELALSTFYHQLLKLSGRNSHEMIKSNKLFQEFYSKPLVESVPVDAEEKPSIEAQQTSPLPLRPPIFAVFDKIKTEFALNERDFPVSISAVKIRLYQEQLAVCSANEINAYLHGILITTPYLGKKTGHLTAVNFFRGLKELGIYQLLFPELDYDFFIQGVTNIVVAVKKAAVNPTFALNQFYGQLIKFSGLNQAGLCEQNRLFAAVFGLQQLLLAQATQISATRDILQSLFLQTPQFIVNQPTQELNNLPERPELSLVSIQQPRPMPLVTQGGVNLYPAVQQGVGKPKNLTIEVPDMQGNLITLAL